MGIKSLSKFLKGSFPHLFEPIHISEYHFRRIAIDTSLYLCNYKALYGDKWLGAFIKLVSCLRENEIHCVFIYDTKAPAEKQAEREERSDARNKLNDRVSALENAIEQFHSTGVVDKILIDFQTKRKIESKRLLSRGEAIVNIYAIENAVKKMRKQLFSISPNDFATTKRLFDILQVPYFDADMEAETMCADLCIQGKVDAVLSEDTDVLAYGAPVFLTKINTLNGTCVRVKYEPLLTDLGLSSEEFLDFCIMCGTDYNKNIFRVGPSKAYQLIQDYSNIETIATETGLDVTILNHVRVRQLFRQYTRSNAKVGYCGRPDFTELQKFLFQKNQPINVETLRKCFLHNDIVVRSSSTESSSTEGAPTEGASTEGAPVESKNDDEEEEIIIVIDDE